MESDKCDLEDISKSIYLQYVFNLNRGQWKIQKLIKEPPKKIKNSKVS
jgi:hypothetical protein